MHSCRISLPSIIVRSIAVGALSVLTIAASAQAAVSLQIQQLQRQARIDLDSHRPDLAVQEYRKILTIDPGNVDAHANLGVTDYFQQNYKEAATELGAAFSTQPGLWKIEALLGMAEKQIGADSQAVTHLDQAFRKVTEERLRIEVGEQLVDLYFQSEDLNKAASVAEQMQQLDPTNIDVLYTAHQVYSELADKTLLAVATLAPSSARMHQLMGDQMARQHNIPGAIREYRRALKADPLLPGVHYELAEVLTESSSAAEKSQAESQYEAALASDPGDERSECRLGIIRLQQNALPQAYRLFQHALQMQPADADANAGLGMVLLAQNEAAKARLFFERAEQSDPTDADVHYHLALLDRRLGDQSGAEQEMGEFKRLKSIHNQIRSTFDQMNVAVPGASQQDNSGPKQ